MGAGMEAVLEIHQHRHDPVLCRVGRVHQLLGGHDADIEFRAIAAEQDGNCLWHVWHDASCWRDKWRRAASTRRAPLHSGKWICEEGRRINLHDHHRGFMNYVQIGKGPAPAVIFAHGWARTHRDFIPAAESLSGHMASLLVDLPGFGETPRPPEGWTTADYADHMAGFIREHVDGPIVYVGHSFGARVGLRLAVRHPELLSGLVLVAGAGLPTQRPALQRW